MPCRGPDSDECAAMDRAELERVLKEMDKVTRMTCELLASIEAGNPYVTDELRVWWGKHKKLDEQRRKQEEQQRKAKEAQAKKAKADSEKLDKALSKLTKEEIVLLRKKL